MLQGLETLSPGLAARVLEPLFLHPPRRRPPEREEAWLRQARRETLPLGVGRLAAWSWGEGRPVLLVHGWAGRGSQLAAFVEPLIDAGHRVVAVDLPGHGASPGRRSSLPEMAAGVEAAADHLGALEGIIAHSAGCAATTIALERGLWARRAVYISPPADLGWFAYQLGRALGLGPEVVDRMRCRIEARFGVRWDDLRGPALAPRIRVPLLAHHDREDPEVPWEHGEELVRAWPGARLNTTSGLGHRRILRDPGVVEESVSFIASRDPRSEPVPASSLPAG